MIFKGYAIEDPVGLSILEVISSGPGEVRSGTEEMMWMISSVEQRNSSRHTLGESVGDGDERGEIKVLKWLAKDVFRTLTFALSEK